MTAVIINATDRFAERERNARKERMRTNNFAVRDRYKVEWERASTWNPIAHDPQARYDGDD